MLEADITNWRHQPGQSSASISAVDPFMNALAQSSGADNVTLNLPVELANYFPPGARIRVTIEMER